MITKLPYSKDSQILMTTLLENVAKHEQTEAFFT